jgi:dihydroorotase
MAEHFDLIVRNGTVVNSAGRRSADIGVRAGRFVTLEAAGSLRGRSGHVFDATGLHVLPGLIDGHVHFREPGLERKEDWLTGSRAAVMGGITSVLEMPNTIPPTAGVEEAREKAQLADQKAYCDFGLFGLLGPDNLDRLPALVRSGLIVGLKAFLGPTTGGLAAPSDEQLLVALDLAREAGLRVAFHAEDAATIAAAEGKLRGDGRSDLLAHLHSRPVVAELSAIERVGSLLAQSGARGHILHLSSAEGARAVDRLRAVGIDLTCEVSAHHCLLSAADYERVGGLLKCNPPVRDAEEGHALLTALAEGRIDCIASDHAPHAPSDKAAADGWGVAAGIAGVETTLALLLTHGVHGGRFSLEQLVLAYAERPAQAWGLWPDKGAIEIGSDADLTVVDLERRSVIRSDQLHGRHQLTPFDGWAARGWPVATIVRGRVVMQDGELLAQPGWGQRVEGGSLRGSP